VPTPASRPWGFDFATGLPLATNAGSGVISVSRLSLVPRTGSGCPSPAWPTLVTTYVNNHCPVVTLMASLRLADLVRVEPARTFSLACDDPLLAGDDNLVLRAAYALQSATGEQCAAHITLMKRIPVAAGLGGGSSDVGGRVDGRDERGGEASSLASGPSPPRTPDRHRRGLDGPGPGRS